MDIHRPIQAIKVPIMVIIEMKESIGYFLIGLLKKQKRVSGFKLISSFQVLFE